MSDVADAPKLSVKLTNEELAIERLKDGLRADFGEVCMEGLSSPTVIEVMLNPDGKIWFDDLVKGMYYTGQSLRPSQAMSICTSAAFMLGEVVSRQNPIVEGELALDNSRFEALISPVVQNPAFAIRKKASSIFSLEKYRDSGILTDINDPRNRTRRMENGFAEQCKGRSHYDILRMAVALRKNILVVGSTGSGKTTLCNAVLDAISILTPEHRVVMIEDTGELQCNAKNFVQMRSTYNVSMTRLLKATMRLRPDRIIVGEVRDGAALDLLDAWGTGHPGGLATVHADDGEGGLARMEQLIRKATPHVDRQMIAQAVDLVVFIDKDKSVDVGRKVKELLVVEGYDEVQQRYVVTRV